MYHTLNGEEIFVIDSHTHLWDGSPANQRNKYGRGWIDCFYAYHKNLSDEEGLPRPLRPQRCLGCP